MSVSSSREVERKFEAADGTPVPEHVGAGFTVEQADELHLVATYYDTAGLRLLRHGATLRHRTGDDEPGWHLKLPAGTDARHELHAEGDADTLPTELLALVRARTGRLTPAPVADMRTTRRVRRVLDTRGNRAASLDDDEVVGRRESDGLVVAWRELEAELAPGVHDTLLDELATALGAAGWSPSASVAKIGRVLTDGGDPRDLPPSPTSTKAAGALLAHLDDQVSSIVANEPGVRAEDPEAVHKMRVATRRLRSALATFRSSLDREVTDPVRAELRWFGGVLGELRDDHVLHERLEAEVGELPGELVLGPVAEQIRMDLRGRAQEHHADVIAVLDGERFVDLMESLHQLVETPPWTSPQGAEVRKRTLRRSARAAVRRVAKSVPDTGAAATDAELHELRKAAKRARYALEAIEPLEGERAAKAAAHFEAVQDLLGDHQDSVVARGVLRRLGASSRGHAQNGFTFGLVHEVEHRRALAARDEWAAVVRTALKPKRLRWLQD